MRISLLLLAVVVVAVLCYLFCGFFGKEKNIKIPNAKSIYDFKVQNIDGDSVALADYRGKVLLIVNVASKCGFTPQYEDLQQLYKKYQSHGFEILGFPANNFMNQEPGTNAEIKQFCSVNFGVTFPMFAKISVAGDDQAPIYTYLTSKITNPDFSGKISWNFNKFLISRTGKIINRFGTREKPGSEEITTAIEQALGKQY